MRLFAATFVTLLLLAAIGVAWVEGAPERELAAAEARLGVRVEAGDVVFQDLRCGPRCDLIREVTKSRYVHVGLVLGEGPRRVVWEALQPVRPTPLAEWLERGVRHELAVYRLTPELRARLPAVEQALAQLAGRPYDGDYQWDDQRLYCSELVVKAVQQATGVALAEPRASGPGSFGAARERIERMTQGRLTEASLVVSPVDLTRSPYLRRVGDELASPATGP